MRKVKKAILDLKSEVLGHFSGNDKQVFAPSAGEKKNSLDMYVFERHRYRSDTDNMREVRKRITQEGKKRVVSSQALPEQYENNCVHEFFSLILVDEEGKRKLESSNWT